MAARSHHKRQLQDAFLDVLQDGFLGRRRKLVRVNRPKSVPPSMVRRDPFIGDLELVAHRLGDPATGEGNRVCRPLCRVWA